MARAKTSGTGFYVVDHAEAIWRSSARGRIGESYNVGGENEWKNIELVKRLCSVLARATNRSEHEFVKLITFVQDRPGHDHRYAINCDKIKRELGWKQSVDFEKGLELTVCWYLDNQAWVEEVRSGEYSRWIERTTDHDNTNSRYCVGYKRWPAGHLFFRCQTRGCHGKHLTIRYGTIFWGTVSHLPSGFCSS